MTPLKQQISLIPFSTEHWYSHYKRRRFENRWDQTFCILLITDVLSVIESANLRQRQNLTQKWSGIRIRIFRLIWIRMYDPSQNCGCITCRRQSFRQVWYKSAVDCMRIEKTEKCSQMAENRLFLSGEENKYSSVVARGPRDRFSSKIPRAQFFSI